MKYKRTSDYNVEAMQLCLCLFDDITEWLHNNEIDFTISDDCIVLNLEKRKNYHVYIGDYIVIHGTSIIVYDQETFEDNFELFDESEE